MGGLFERAVEQSQIRGAIDAAAAGTGRTLVLAGPAGIGRSALVEHAREVARAAGFLVLDSSPTPVSTALPHGLVRDWLGPQVRVRRPGVPPFDGPAGELAQALSAPTDAHQVWNLASLDFALTWTLESLAESHPLLLIVDDVQWADAASLQVLDLLSARNHLLPAVLLLGLRTGEPTESQDVVDRITARGTRLDLAPLSVEGVELVRTEVGASPEVARLGSEELWRVTGGVPFLLRQVLTSGYPDNPPDAVVDSVRERLSRLGPTSETIARAAAVLGADSELDALAALTGLTVAGLADPLDLLAGAGVLSVEMWRAAPAHPLIAEALLSSMPPSERSALHGAAATYLREQGRAGRDVAGHLLHTLPADDPAVVEALRAAGRTALEEGAADAAAHLLLRAVGETRPEDTDLELLALAAGAHLHAGRRKEAFELWSKACDRAEDPVRRAALLADIGDARMTTGERKDAAASYEQAVLALTEAGHDSSSPEMRHVLVRMGFTRALYDGAHTDIVGAVTEAVHQSEEKDSPTDRLLFALASSELAVRCQDRDTARDLALRALGDGALLAEQGCEGIGFYVASGVLSWADAYTENLQALDAAIGAAREGGSVLGFAMASYCRGLLDYRQGRLRRAIGEFQPALEMRTKGWADFAEPGIAGAALTYVGLGQYPQALRLEPALRAAAARGQFLSALPQTVAGVVRAVHGDHEQALADYRRASELMSPHPDNASIVEWRELSSWSLRALGRRDEALGLAEEAVALARQWGAPRALGFALRTLAQVTSRDRSIALLRESVTLLDGAGCVDYRARSQTDLADLLLDGTPAERAEGVAVLHGCFEYGRSTDVPPVALRATRLLLRAGEHVSAETTDPVGSLTPGERRVVDHAIGGDTNRQIAQKLFVSVKAVEWHLSNAYRKLGISSRAELSGAVYGESGASSSDM